MPAFDPFQFKLLLVNYAALFVLLPVVVARGKGALLDGISLGERVGLAGATFLAFHLRSMEGWMFRHENAHAYRLLDTIIDPSSELHVYGSGYIALFHPLFRVLPPASEFLIFGVKLLGTFSVIPAGLLVTRLFGRRTGLVSALALATQNTHTLHSASESRFVVAMFFLLLALWLATEVRRTQRLDVAIACALAAAPTAQMRPELVWLPLLVLAFAFIPGDGFRPGRSPAPWLVPAGLVVLLAGHFHWMWRLHSDLPANRLKELMGVGSGLSQALRDGPMLADPMLLPRLGLLLILVTAFVTFRSRPRALLLLVGTAVGFVLLYAQASSGIPERQRFLVPAHTFLALLVGPGALTLARLAEVRSGLRGLSPVLVLALIFASPAAEFRDQSTITTWEYAEFSGSSVNVPRGCVVVTQPMFTDTRKMPAYSPHELRFRTGASALVTTEGHSVPAEVREALESDTRCVLYLRTSACFACDPENTGFCDAGAIQGNGTSVVHPRCSRFEEQVVLEPLDVFAIDSAEFELSLFAWPRVPFEIGFFRIIGLSDIAPSSPPLSESDRL